MTTFEDLNLNKQLLNALEDLGLKNPTEIQEQVFSVVMSGKDVCGIAQTGTGKTFAYLLPCLRQYQFSKEKNPQIIILVPTRELVVQVLEEVKKLTQYMSIAVCGVYGGVNLSPQVSEVLQGVDLLVATPGRLVDLLKSGAVKTKNVKKLIIDEFDEMLDLGFRAQLKYIFEKLPERRQNLLFSATHNKEVDELVDAYFNHPTMIAAAPMGTPVATIEQSRYDIPNFYSKVNLLKTLLQQNQTMTKVLVFVNSKAMADQLYDELYNVFKTDVAVIHANKAQNKRLESVNNFAVGTLRILIATDLLARGIDIEEVTDVVNFDFPEETDHYIHRIGRTGRKGNAGRAIAFVLPKDNLKLQEIEQLMNTSLTLVDYPLGFEVSTRLLLSEVPKKEPLPKEKVNVKTEISGPAFHEKLAKNSKVNVRRNHAEEMKKKYGKSYEKRTRNK
ncbi:MAG: DEAD/DEAH box helicase [Pseudarcicella sp.]|nr:DEAD/DEAH box helicase [Pseudarcicella sp.]